MRSFDKLNHASHGDEILRRTHHGRISFAPGGSAIPPSLAPWTSTTLRWTGGRVGGGLGGLLVRPGLEGRTEHSVPFFPTELDAWPSGMFACPL